MRLEQPEMTATKKRNYLKKVVNDADLQRKKRIVDKSNATKKYNAVKISEAERDRIHKYSDISRLELNEYIKSVSMRKPRRRLYSSNHRFRSNSAQMLGLVRK